MTSFFCGSIHIGAKEKVAAGKNNCCVWNLTYGTEFVLFLAVLENSVLPMG